MDLLPILYSHKLYCFNMSSDLKYLTFKSSALYVGDIDGEKAYQLIKDSGIYYSTFDSDSTFVVITGVSSCFRLSDNFQKKLTVRMPSSSYCEKKPLVYGNSFFYKNFGTYKGKTGSRIFQQIDNRNRVIFESNQYNLRDYKIYNNKLLAVFGTSEFDKICIYRHDLLLNQNSIFEYPFKARTGYKVCIVPEKNLIVTLIFSRKNNYDNVIIKYYQINTFLLLHEQEIINIPTLAVAPNIGDIVAICKGKYVVVAHPRKGLMFFNTDDFSLEKVVHLPGIKKLIVCDNDDFCCAVSSGDLIVFTPVVTEENRQLSKKLKKYFENVGLCQLIINN